ncbi:MAG: YggT family protein [Gaiellales bacterium]|jgi:YggT family protein
MHTLGNFINSLVWMYTLMILAAVILSWVRLPYSDLLARTRDVIDGMTSPYLRVFRRFVPPLGGLDVSPMLALIALQIIGGFAAGAVGHM